MSRQRGWWQGGWRTRAVVIVIVAGFVGAGPSAAAAASTYTVTGTGDAVGATCTGTVCQSLRAAVNQADTDPGSTVQLGAGTFVLGGAGVSNQLSITANMTVQGAGPAQTAIDQTDGADRVINITPGNTVTVAGIEITGGRVSSTLTALGGGIANAGTLALRNDLVDHNSATGAAGSAGGNGIAATGGGIWNSGTSLTVVDTTIEHNAATGGTGGGPPGGGGTAGTGGQGLGGGIYSETVLTVSSSTIDANIGQGGNGGAASGGGNTAGNAGSGDGGGIYAFGTSAALVNSTLTGNSVHAGAIGSATGGAGTGFGGVIEGGGILMLSAPLTLASDTISANTADSANAVIVDSGNLFTNASTAINDTIIAHGSAPAQNNCNFTGGTHTDGGHNLEDDGPSSPQCGFSSTHNDLVATDPLLAASLASNGGLTQTLALAANSPAIGAGGQCTDPTAGGAPLTTDQRHLPRPNPCDIGAFQSQPPANTSLPAISGTAQVAQTLTCSPGTWTGDGTLSFAYQWLRDGASITGATSSSDTVTAADAGHALSCQVTATGTYGQGTATSAAVSIPSPDTSAPTISIAAPANGATYTQGQVVNSSYACADPDGLADIATCAGPVASGSPINTSTTGSHTFTVNAADRAGNTVSQTVTYTVGSPRPGTPTPTFHTSGRVFTKALGATVLVHPGIKVSCPAGGRPCTANLTATAIVPATAARAKTKRIVIGRANFTIPAGKSRDLTFKLNRAGAKLLRKLGHLRVKLVMISRVDHNKPITTTKTITIKPAPRKHRH